ncbi:class I SAM-dependent methyltransferase [Gracilimonas sp.]|uniref:class I SAM-dependent methyltransferase n=1 Tax=Gracilimonas sp. TaxID=1974203 RepID=UPI0032EE2871
MDPKELAQQLRKPTGEAGLEVATALNESNQELYDLAFEVLNLKPRQNILEIGFGNGKHFSQYFQAQPQLNLTGVDFSTDMCEEAMTRNSQFIEEGKLSIHCAETSSLPFQENEFDLILAINVIYFLDPPESHLQEIRRVLKPNGSFLVGYRPRHSIEHLEFTRHNFVLYETDVLVDLMESNGFKVSDQKTKSYQKLAVDETEFEVKDACLVLQK